MATKCPHCGAEAVLSEGYENQEDDYHRVCTECGVVLDEGCLKAKADFCNEGSVFVNYNMPNKTVGYSLPKGYMDRNTSHTSKITECKLACLLRIKTLVQFFSGGDNLLTAANNLFDRAYTDPTFKHTFIDRKEILASCCVFVACRENNIPVTLAHMSSLMSCSQFRLGAVLKELQSALKISTKSLDIDSYVDFVCQKLELDDSVATTTKKLIPIMKKAWVFEGRSFEITVKAVAFIAWESLNFSKQSGPSATNGHKPPKFDNDKKKYSKRVTEIRAVLCKLASAIPWLSQGDIKQKDIAYHVKDILSMQKFLFLQLQTDDSVKNTAQSTSSENAAETEQKQLSGSTIEAAVSHEEHNLKKGQMNGKRYLETCMDPPKPAKRFKLETPNSGEDSVFSSHIEEFRCLAPSNVEESCSQRTSIEKSYHPHLDSEILTELDIPESDMNLYLKSPLHVKDCKMIEGKPLAKGGHKK